MAQKIILAGTVRKNGGAASNVRLTAGKYRTGSGITYTSFTTDDSGNFRVCVDDFQHNNDWIVILTPDLNHIGGADDITCERFTYNQDQIQLDL